MLLFQFRERNIPADIHAVLHFDVFKQFDGSQFVRHHVAGKTVDRNALHQLPAGCLPSFVNGNAVTKTGEIVGAGITRRNRHR